MLRKRTTSEGSLGGGTTFTQQRPDQLLHGGQGNVNMQSVVDAKGEHLNQVGTTLNQANTEILNITTNNNSDNQSNSSIATTSNFFDFGALEAQGNMRPRYA